MATYKISISRLEVNPEYKAKLDAINVRGLGYSCDFDDLEKKIHTEILVTEITESQWRKIQLEIVKILEKEIDA